MLRSAAVTVISNRLGQRTGLDTQIISELQAAQQRLEEEVELPWFLIKDTTLSTTPASRKVDLPVGFLLEVDDMPLSYLAADGSQTPLGKEDFDVLHLAYKETTGSPKAYSLVGEQLQLFPIPDAGYSLPFYYYGQDTVLSTDVENGWLRYASQAIIGETGLMMARFLRDKQAESYFTRELQLGIVKMLTRKISRDSVGRDSVLGG